jgi:hypothetical protein
MPKPKKRMSARSFCVKCGVPKMIILIWNMTIAKFFGLLQAARA